MADPGTVYSKPVMTVNGSGDITPMAGTKTIELVGIANSITIDPVPQEVYNGSPDMNPHMSGGFPQPVPGIDTG